MGRIALAFTFEMQGDKIIDKKYLAQMIKEIGNEPNSLDVLKQSVEKYAEKAGYFDAKIGVTLKSDSILVLDIESGPVYKIDSIAFDFRGEPLPENGADLYFRYGGRAASEENITGALEDIVDEYSNNGYPFAQSKLISLEKVNSSELNLSIEATAGPYVSVDSLLFESNKSVSQDYLKRVSGWREGEQFSQNQLDNSIARLNSLGYLRVEKPPGEYYYNDYQSCLLTYDIKQRGSNRVEGALGYNPKTNNTEGFIFGFLNLSFYNPFGDGKSFFIKWNKPSQSSSNLALNFDYPYPLGSPLETSFRVEQEKLSEFYLALRLGADITQELSSNYQFNTGLQWSKITARGDIFRSVYNSRIYQASLGIRLSNQFENINEINGRSLAIKLIYLHKRLYSTLGQEPPDNIFNPFKAAINLHLGLPFTTSLFGDIKANFEGFSNDESLISPAEMVKLGGRTTLRGYSEEQFLTPRAAWGNLEFGFYDRGGFQGYVFSDMAYARLTNIYAESEFLRFKNEFLFGAGFGFRIFSGQTGLDFNLGWNKNSKLSQGILYLALDNRF